MNPLRRAGVWLGLVADDDERAEYGMFDQGIFDPDPPEPTTPVPPRRPRSLVRQGVPASAAATSPLAASSYPSHPISPPIAPAPVPAPQGRAVRSGVRPLARPKVASPQVQLPDLATSAGDRGSAAMIADNPGRRYQITTLHPTGYNEARSVGEHFRDGSPVIMNLTGMDEAEAKRLVDFAAGLAFGLRGSMERVTNRVFLLSPSNVQVSAEDKARIAENGFFDQG